MWLNRLPPDYRRRVFTNVAILCGFVAFIFAVPRLGQTGGTIAIEALIVGLILFAHVMPIVRLLRAKPEPGRMAFVIYGIWIGSYVLVAFGLFIQSRTLVTAALLVAIVAMLTCYIAYRKIILPSVFGGDFRERLDVVRAAREADRRDRDAFIESLRKPDDQ